MSALLASLSALPAEAAQPAVAGASTSRLTTYKTVTVKGLNIFYREAGPSNGPAIQTALAPMAAAGYTPTAATLVAAADVIGQPSAADQGETSPKYILLVTDGWHMARALRHFRAAGEAAGMQVEAAPMGLATQLQTPGLEWLPSSLGYRRTREVLHEAVGRLAGA